MLKKNISCLLLLIFFISSATTSMAASTQQEKAVTLNKINVLIGDGVNFNLDGQLKESEAATFIVRVLGVESEVLRNAEEYKKTNFTDVEPTAWYSAYVGYVAKNNIVGGYGDGTYRPNNYVTEKQFIKMVLGALGYSQGVDFDWSEVYSFAYEKGLFEDASYATRTKDNKNYKRGEVIDVLHATLTANLKSSNETVIERLVEKKFVSEEIASEHGLIQKDTIPMKIVSVTSKSSTILEIKLNEKATLTPGYNVNIYEKDNIDNTLAIRQISIEGDVVTINTVEQNPEITYAVELKGFKDIDGNINNVMSSLENVKNNTPVVTSSYFRIGSVEAISRQELKVAFTHPITDAVESPFNYILKENGNEILIGDFSNIAVKKAHGADNEILVFLNNYMLKEGATYTFEVLGALNSKYNVPIHGGRGDSFDFTVATNIPAIDQSIVVTSTEPVAKNYIRVTFNKDVDEESALSNVNYSLLDVTTGVRFNNAFGATLSGVGENKYREVTVRFLNMKKDHTYELTAKNVQDMFKKSTISENTQVFYGYPDVKSALDIELAYALNQQLVKVYFTEKVTENIVDAFFSIDGISIIKKVYDPKEPIAVTLYLSSNTPVESGREYTLRVSSLKDRYNELLSKVFTTTVKGTTTKLDDVSVTNVQYIAANKVLVTYNRAIDTTSNPSNKYRIEYKDNNATKTIPVSSVSYINDMEAVLTLSATTTGIKEKLHCVGIIDLSGKSTNSIITEITR